jgi:hypothetical protein
MTGTENERREERNGKEGRARGTQVLSGGRKGKVHTARVKGVWREYIKTYDSRSYIDYRV